MRDINRVQKKKFSAGGVTFGESVQLALPLMRKTEEQILEAGRQAAVLPASVVEFRADDYEDAGDSEQLTALLKELKALLPDKALLFTLRTSGEGGKISVTEEKYQDILKTAVRSGSVDLVDDPGHPAEIGAAAKEILRFCRAEHMPVILSNHDFGGTPGRDELVRRMLLMEEAGADCAKIACMPGSRGEAGRLMAVSALASEKLSIPHIVIAMGELGKRSRIHAETFGSAISFGCLPGEESAPGQVDVLTLAEECRKASGFREKVFLTGFMGAGKSTVARILSEKMELPCVEMDGLIEEQEGMSISLIFEKYGEEDFREAETALLTSLADMDGAVVSTGGGLVLREENRALMHCLGRVVHLEVSPGELYRRLKGRSSNRPNIRNRMSVEGIRELLEQRRPCYEAAADQVIEADHLGPADCAERVFANMACP